MGLIFVLTSLFLCQGAQPSRSPEPAGNAVPDPETTAKLAKVRRIYVDSFGGDDAAKQIQAMVIDALAEAKRFVVTENQANADAILRGHTLEQAHRELHSSSEGTAARGGAIFDSSTSTETLKEASIAVRLVDQEGDVIWATTKESKGAKYKGPSADVADQVVKQLLGDITRLQALSKEKESPK